MRPYGPNAPWNIPVEGLPKRKDWVELLWNDSFTDRPNRNFNLNNDGYTYPVYEVVPGTPEYPVEDRNGWGNITTMPFDSSWAAAAGTDAQVIVLDPETGREWNLWQVSFDGSKVKFSNGSLVEGSYWTKEDGWPLSRGCGIQYLAMLVRPWEVKQGKIEHALSMPIVNTSTSEYVAPATKLEHKTGRPDGIPEGARFSLDVSYEEIEAHLNSLPVSQRTKDSLRPILVALKDYGWFITDTAGSSHLQLEDITSAKEEWAELGMINQTASDGKVYPRDALDGLIRADNIVSYPPSDEYGSAPVDPLPEPEKPIESPPAPKPSRRCKRIANKILKLREKIAALEQKLNELCKGKER